MRITCPSCEKALRVNDNLAGKRIKCPACGQVLRVPDLSEAVEAADEAPPPKKPRPVSQEAVTATRPAKKRIVDDEDEDRPRKRRPEDDEPEDDEDDRPRKKKKKKKKKKAAPLLSWPILAAGGGLIAVAAIVLVVVFFWTGSGGGGGKGGGGGIVDAKPATVKLMVASKVGDEREMEARIKTNIKADIPDPKPIKKDIANEVILKAKMKTLAVNKKGTETSVELTINEFKLIEGGKETEIVKPGNTYVAREGPIGPKITPKGKSDPAAIVQLYNLLSTNSQQSEALLDAFATEQQQKPGDTWAMNKAGFIKFFKSIPGTVVAPNAEDSISGSGKFVGRTTEDGKTYLDFELSMSAEGRVDEPGNSIQGSMKGTMSMRLPEDYSTGYVRLAVQMTSQNSGTSGGRQSSFEMIMDYVETVRYLPRSEATPKTKGKDR